jgi:hypothetical protein
MNGAVPLLPHMRLLHCHLLQYYNYMYEGSVIITVYEYNIFDYSSSNSSPLEW